jgi:hypothetical protein
MEKHEMISENELYNRVHGDDFSLLEDKVFGKYFKIVYYGTNRRYLNFKNTLQETTFEDFYNHVLELEKIEIWKNMK